jgi:hypothetical protein
MRMLEFGIPTLLALVRLLDTRFVDLVTAALHTPRQLGLVQLLEVRIRR